MAHVRIDGGTLVPVLKSGRGIALPSTGLTLGSEANQWALYWMAVLTEGSFALHPRQQVTWCPQYPLSDH